MAAGHTTTTCENTSSFSSNVSEGIWITRGFAVLTEYETDISESYSPDPDRQHETDSAYGSDADIIESIVLRIQKKDGIIEEDAKNLQDFIHMIWKSVRDGHLTTVPLQNPQQILDLGTGTGIWAIEIGEKYPSAEVTGIDISNIQPGWVPPNVTFFLDDYNLKAYGEVKRYDMIHARELAGTVKDWPGLIAKCYGALNPGGWFELAGASIHITPTDTSTQSRTLHERANAFIAAGTKSGMSFDISSDLQEWLEEAGFVEVEAKKITVPVGGETLPGVYNRVRLCLELSDFCARLLSTTLEWSFQELTVFAAFMRLELSNSKLRATHNQVYYTVRGKKPLEVKTEGLQ